MRVVLQRVVEASVTSEGKPSGAIGTGLVSLVGVTHHDGAADVEAVASKIAGLRIFADAAGKMNVSVVDAGGSILVVSQFTLYGDARRGRRPSFTDAAPPETAEPLVEMLCNRLSEMGLPVETGRFQTAMQVSLINDGPVTVIIETVDGKVV